MTPTYKLCVRRFSANGYLKALTVYEVAVDGVHAAQVMVYANGRTEATMFGLERPTPAKLVALAEGILAMQAAIENAKHAEAKNAAAANV